MKCESDCKKNWDVIFDVKFSELSIGAVKILKKIHINKVVFVYLTKKHEISNDKNFSFHIFTHKPSLDFYNLWIFASMEANLQNPCIDFFKFKMAVSNIAA